MCSYIHLTHSTASKTIDHQKVCNTTKQFLAMNSKITGQRLFELSEMIDIFPWGKFSAHRQEFSVTWPVSKYFFTSHKINRWAAQNSLNDSLLSTTTNEIKPWQCSINSFSDWINLSKPLFIPYAVGQRTSHSSENMPTREDRTPLVDKEVYSGNIVECLPIDWCINKSTSADIDNRIQKWLFTCWISFALVFNFIYCWVLIFALFPFYIVIYMF